jgi:type IV pilus assembly protein PilM
MGPSARTVIGIDIGRHTIKAAQLQEGGGRYRAFALLLLPRPEPEKEIGPADALTLKNALRRQGFAGHCLALSAPDQILLRTTVEVPSKVLTASAEQIIRLELARLHNVPPNSFEMAHWELAAANSARPITQTLAVGCPHDAAEALLDLFEEQGFRVAALDLRSAAAVRACRPLLLPAPQMTALVDLGWRSTSVLFVCGRSLVYERSVQGAPIGDLTAKLTEAFAIAPVAAYQIIGTIGPGTQETAGPGDGGLGGAAAPAGAQYDPESLEAIRKHIRAHFDRLLEELRVPLSYANHQFPGEGVKRLLLLGGGAGVPELPSYFQTRLGIEVKRAAPGDLIDCPPELSSKTGNPALTCAVGLAQFKGI